MYQEKFGVEIRSHILINSQTYKTTNISYNDLITDITC
jgi:hypothetical protein